MACVLTSFNNFSKYYDKQIDWEEIEQIYENYEEKKRRAELNKNLHQDNRNENINSDSDDNILNDDQQIENISIIQCAIQNEYSIQDFRELCCVIRNLNSSNADYDSTNATWKKIIEIAPRKNFLALIYALIRLGTYNVKKKIYRELSIEAARTYFLSLTIPGSKSYHIFDEAIIQKSIEVFQILKSKEKMLERDRIGILIHFVSFCDDLKLLFRNAYFDECKSTRNAIIWELIQVLYNHHKNGFENKYEAALHNKIFEVFSEIINKQNGDPEEILMKIMQISFNIHTMPSTIKRIKHFEIQGTFYEHISDWFIESIGNYPKILENVLHNYIKFIVANENKLLPTNKLQYALDYAAKYDANIYSKCNESIFPFLENTGLKDADANIRQNSLELCNRILLIESQVDWTIRINVSKIPREVYGVQLLIEHLLDTNNNIKLKALHGFYEAYYKGTANAKKIISEGIRFANFNNEIEISLPDEQEEYQNEVHFPIPQPIEPNFTFEGFEIIQPLFNELPNKLYRLIHNNMAYVRKAAISLLELLVNLNPLIIYNTSFLKYCSALSRDPVILVRRQAMVMIDAILSKLPGCYPVIWTWCSIIVPLFEDSDMKNTEIAWESFKKRVFDNIKRTDQSNQPEDFMPWRIIRVLLSTEQRQFLEFCVKDAMKKQCINQNVISIIESHTLTRNSTEAWVLLSFIAGKVKFKEPDSLVFTFTKLLSDQSCIARRNLIIIVEILSTCVNQFSQSALNKGLDCAINSLKEGTIQPFLIGKLFDLCININVEINKNSIENEDVGWIEDISNACENYIMGYKNKEFKDERKFLSYLHTYSESNLELRACPNQEIIEYILKLILILSSKNYHDEEDLRILNSMIILATRFSIPDSVIADNTCSLFKLILQKIDKLPVINTVLIAVTDLCKRHTQIIESKVIDSILMLLKSPNPEVRLETFKNLSILVLQDQIKLRGDVLKFFLTCMLDESNKLSNLATQFFQIYLETKNSKLFQICLQQCPYTFNNYLHFDGFTNLSEHLLNGDERLRDRHLLYKHFLLEMDHVNMLFYFDNLIQIYQKLKNDPSIKSPEGYSTITDIIYILKNICQQNHKKELKEAQEKASQSTDLMLEITDAEKSNLDQDNPKKSRRNNAITIRDAMIIVEKAIYLMPKICECLLNWDKVFRPLLDSLNYEICKNFNSIIEQAQPETFWERYRLIEKTSNTSKRKAQSDHEEGSDIELDRDPN